MITDYFLNRDQSIAKVNMAMNYLSRVVRENMVIFDYDSRTNNVSFLTESNALINGTVVTRDNSVFFDNLTVEKASEVYSNKSIDSKVNERISNFVNSLKEDNYNDAENTFSTVLNAFEDRNRINEVRAKLERKIDCFGEAHNILETSEYKKLEEVKDKLVEYIKENKETLFNYGDIKNSLTLSNALGKAFNAEKKSWEDLSKQGSINIPYDTQKTVFEMICSQELIRTELSESKDNFSGSWVSNEKISKLASCIYNDDEVVIEALGQAIYEVPYLALATKADIKTVFASIYESSDVANISQKDIREYVARIFEFKKPIKAEILKELNESYSINIQNLKFVPTFSNLAKAQSVLFEALGALSDKESVIRDVVSEFSKIVRKKGGIQALDINDFIFEVFSKAGADVTDELFHEVDLEMVVTGILEGKDKKPFDKDEKGEKDKIELDKKEMNGKKEKNGKNGDKNIAVDDSDAEEMPDEKDMEKGKKKKGGLKDSDKDLDTLTDEGMEEEGEEVIEEPAGLGLGDSEMTELMSELENLFNEVDWDAIANQEANDDEGSEEEPLEGVEGEEEEEV